MQEGALPQTPSPSSYEDWRTETAKRDQKAKPLRDRLEQIQEQMKPLLQECELIYKELAGIYPEAFERGKKDAKDGLPPREAGKIYLYGYSTCETQKVIRRPW